MADPSLDLIPRTIGGYSGWGFGAIATVFGIWTQHRKGRVEETTVAVASWKAILDQYTLDVKDLRTELRAARAENDILRVRLEEQDEIYRRRAEKQDELIRDLRLQVEGLTRQLAQAAQSTLVVLGDASSRDDPSMVRALKRIEGESA